MLLRRLWSAPTVTTTIASVARERLRALVDRLDRVGADVDRLGHLARLGAVAVGAYWTIVAELRLVGGVGHGADLVASRCWSRLATPRARPGMVVPLRTATVNVAGARARLSAGVRLGRRGRGRPAPRRRSCSIVLGVALVVAAVEDDQRRARRPTAIDARRRRRAIEQASRRRRGRRSSSGGAGAPRRARRRAAAWAPAGDAQRLRRGRGGRARRRGRAGARRRRLGRRRRRRRAGRRAAAASAGRRRAAARAPRPGRRRRGAGGGGRRGGGAGGRAGRAAAVAGAAARRPRLAARLPAAAGGRGACWAALPRGPAAGAAGGAGCAAAAARLLGSALTRCLQLGGALGRAARPFAQALDLARLREVEQREHGEAEHGGEARVGAVLLDLVLRPRRPGSRA